ncbi:hypothetical protein IV203_027742 [Nitzschia inconspicua]|uniref:Protein kinase domain-containing protein n=1 Tax=Nitzschia inconspicua TaxID=303405 RepID=A0A9K3LZE3_9STRA|nr:hypothetical protein IV203_027742 [Nitzschia inconspicua]
MLSPDQPSPDTVGRTDHLVQRDRNCQDTPTRKQHTHSQLHWRFFRNNKKRSPLTATPQHCDSTNHHSIMEHNNNGKGLLSLRKHANQDQNSSGHNKWALRQSVALFDHSELILGDLVGKGAFCSVHELQGVRLNNGLVRPYFSRPWWDNKLYQADRAREYIRDTCREENNVERSEDSIHVDMDGSGSSDAETQQHSLYVVKHLRPNLATERSFKIFLHAASDLRREYEILSRLSHPNIVQLQEALLIQSNYYYFEGCCSPLFDKKCLLCD